MLSAPSLWRPIVNNNAGFDETGLAVKEGLHASFQEQYEATPDKRKVPEPLNRTTRLAIWIMLSTLTRVAETSMARWEHVDLTTGQSALAHM